MNTKKPTEIIFTFKKIIIPKKNVIHLARRKATLLEV
jgi:hypothetical protein